MLSTVSIRVAALSGLVLAASAAHAQVGKDVVIKVSDLPKPYASTSANNGPNLIPRPENAQFNLPAGFKCEVFAEDFRGARWLTVAPNGDVLVTEAGSGRVILLRDTKGTGKPDVRETFAEGLSRPFGIQVYKGGLYVACVDSVVRFSYKDGQTKAEGAPQTLVSGLPTNGHWTRGLAINEKTNKMYVSVGSANDYGDMVTGRAVVREYNIDGTGERVYAEGLRNAVGITIQPKTGTLWAAVNERDGLGDDLPPDYVTSVKENAFYGWPNYYSGTLKDPRAQEAPEYKKRAVVPDVLVVAHAAVLGLTFYTGKMFPKEYQGDAFATFHGSGNRTKRVGYSVVRIPFKNGKATGGYQDFMTGWMLGEDKREVWGRPVGIAQAKDGALLVVDDGAQKVWRISYGK